MSGPRYSAVPSALGLQIGAAATKTERKRPSPTPSAPRLRLQALYRPCESRLREACALSYSPPETVAKAKLENAPARSASSVVAWRRRHLAHVKRTGHLRRDGTSEQVPSQAHQDLLGRHTPSSAMRS